MWNDAPILAVTDPGGSLALHHLRDHVDGDRLRRHQHWLAISVQTNATVLTPEWLAKPVYCVGKFRLLRRMVGVDNFPKRRRFPRRCLGLKVGNIKGAQVRSDV